MLVNISIQSYKIGRCFRRLQGGACQQSSYVLLGAENWAKHTTQHTDYTAHTHYLLPVNDCGQLAVLPRVASHCCHRLGIQNDSTRYLLSDCSCQSRQVKVSHYSHKHPPSVGWTLR